MLSSDNNKFTLSLNSLYCEADVLIPSLPPDVKSTTTRCCVDVHDEGVLSCKNPHRKQYYEEGKGYELTNKFAKGISSSLPIYIPIPTQDTKHLPLTLSSSHLGITIGGLYPKAREKRYNVWKYKSGTSPDLEFANSPVYSNSKKILFYSGPDLLIEGMNRDKYNFPIYEQMKSAGISTSTTPDFSVNINSCAFGQIVNSNRTLAVGEEMSFQDIEVIPNVFAVNSYLLEMWVEYLNNTNEVSVIYINCQCQRSDSDLINLQRYIKELISRTSVNIILHGYRLNKKNLEAIKDAACRIHFADSAPFGMAIRGRKYQTYDSIKRKLVTHTLVTNDNLLRISMIQTSIQAREQYLRDVFYSGMICDYSSFTNLSSVV